MQALPQEEDGAATEERIEEYLGFLRDPEGNLPPRDGPELRELEEQIEAWRKAAGK